MVRLRHASDIQADGEANEIILINSHDGASSYQMLAGLFRYACSNGLVVGQAQHDIRIAHKGSVQTDVIEGAFRVLEDFKDVDQAKQAMKALQLEPPEAKAFHTAALALRYSVDDIAEAHTPISAEQLAQARRPGDEGTSLWATFNRVQENLVRGGLTGRTKTQRRMRTRPVTSIDASIHLNRALWLLAEEMRRLKAA